MIATTYSRPRTDETAETTDINHQSPVLGLVARLCKSLDAHDIQYCHWKSNAALDRSASGDNDLDLLVRRADVQRFTTLLYGLNFKQARPRAVRELPGILNFYGYDVEGDRLVHVHVHYQLVLGDDMTKNYRLPLEEPYIASAIRAGVFKIPAAEYELLVFVVRMLLKHGTWDAILTGQGRLSRSERQELDDLQERAHPARLRLIVRHYLPFIDVALFERCLRSLGARCPIRTRVRLARQLHHALRAHARRPLASDVCLKMLRRFVWGTRRYVFRIRSKKRLENSGALIAIVGGDGAGKSTAVEELHRWLSKNFDTARVHLGKPRWSLTSFAVKGTVKLGRLLLAPLRGKSSADSGGGFNPDSVPSYVSVFWYILTARDRYRAYVKARRLASNGYLVVCDRYPMPQIKVMDGARGWRMKNLAERNGWIRKLIAFEAKYYAHIMPPEFTAVLRLDPEIAVQRRSDEDPGPVRTRNLEIWEYDWQTTGAHVIDASQPREKVLSQLKSLIWSQL